MKVNVRKNIEGIVFGAGWVMLMAFINPILGIFYSIPIGLTIIFALRDNNAKNNL